MKWRSFTLGESTVWLDRQLVRRGGQDIKLQPKVIEVLSHLVAAEGETVSRESIKSHIWGKAEADDLLTNAVWKLRKALGDDGGLIETIPRYGYRLTQTPFPLQKARAVNTYSFALLAGAVVAALIAIGSFTYLSKEPGAPASIAPLPLLRLTGIESGPTFSSDGRSVAFVSAYDSYHTDLFVYDRNTGESQQLSSDAAWNYHPAFSPDGQRLAVFRYIDGQCQIEVYRVSNRELTSSFDCGQVDGRSLGWIPDSTSLLVALRTHAGLSPALLDPETGASTEVRVGGQAIVTGAAPSMSHNADQVAVVGRVTEGERIEIYGEHADQSPTFPHIYALTWARDDSELFFTTYMSPDLTQLWRWRWKHSAPQPWVALPGRNTQLSTSPDGLELAYDSTRETADLWILSPTGRGLRRVAMTSMNEAQPVINWRGDLVAFLADEPQPGSVWIRDLQTDSARPLGYQGRPVLSLSWIGSTTLVGTVQSPAGPEIVQLNLDSRPDSFRFADGDWTRVRTTPGDSPLVLYYLDRSRTVFRSDEKSEMPSELPLKQVKDFRPDPDNQWIYFTQTEAPGLWRFNLHSYHVERAAADLDRHDWGNFAVTPDGYVYVRRQQENALLIWRDHDHGNERVLAAHKGIAQGSSLSISGTGTLLARVQARYEGDIMKLATSH